MSTSTNMRFNQSMTFWFNVQRGEEVLEGGERPDHWMFELLKGFSQLQSTIENAVQMYLRGKSPALGDVLAANHVHDRLRDIERWAYVKAIAADVGYTSDLLAASSAFSDCRRVRNLLAHASSLDLVTSHERPYQHYLIPSDWKKPVPDPLTPALMRKLVVQCAWLRWFVNYLAFRGGARYISPAARLDADGQPVPQYVEILPPPPLPVSLDWTPEGLVRNLSSE